MDSVNSMILINRHQQAVIQIFIHLQLGKTDHHQSFWFYVRVNGSLSETTHDNAMFGWNIIKPEINKKYI